MTSQPRSNTPQTQVTLSLGELAGRLEADLDGDPDVVVVGAGPIETATSDQVTFLANPRYTSLARSTGAAAVIVSREAPVLPRPTLRIENPYLAFAQVLAWFHPTQTYAAGVHSTAVIASSSKLGAGCHIGPYVVIMDDVVIGSDSVLLPHVVIYPNCLIGSRFFAHAHSVVREGCRLGDGITLQNGAIIGSDGFGFAQNSDKRWTKIPQVAPVVLEGDVEVQANACIDRASVGSTHIARGSKIDNLVQVGHGCYVGEDTLLCAQVGLAGSTRIGNRSILAGQAGVAGHCTIGNEVVVTAQSGVPGDVADGMTVSGYPAMDNRRWLKTIAMINRLPSVFRNKR